MGEFSKIEWTDHTFNPWIGCQKVSTGCDNCYAEALMDKRYGRVQWGPHGERKRTSEANWRKPLQWAKAANGSRPRVFCASLADWLDNKAPEQWREDLAVVIDATPQLDWLLLTRAHGGREMRCLIKHSGTWQKRQRKRRVEALCQYLHDLADEHERAYEAWKRARFERPEGKR